LSKLKVCEFGRFGGVEVELKAMGLRAVGRPDVWRNAELSVRRMMLIIVIILKETYSTAGFCPYDF